MEKSVAIMGIAMALIVALQVFCRYVLNHSLFWSEELARYLLVWLSFLGATVAYYRKLHPGIDFFILRLNLSLQRYLRIFVYLVSISLFVVMIYHGVSFAYFIKAQISPALAIPKWIIFAVIPISGSVFLIHCLAFIQAEFRYKS